MCLTPCFVTVLIVLLQELKKIKLTLYQCIIYLDKGLDEMIRIIALEKITFPNVPVYLTAYSNLFRPLFTTNSNNLPAKM